MSAAFGRPPCRLWPHLIRNRDPPDHGPASSPLFFDLPFVVAIGTTTSLVAGMLAGRRPDPAIH